MRLFYTFFLCFTLLSCKKNGVYILTQSNPGTSSKDSFYFKAKLNGTDVNWVVPSHKNEASFIYNAGASIGYTDFSNQCLEGYCYYMSASTQIFRTVPDVRPQMNVAFNMATAGRGRDVILSWFVPGTKIYQTTRRNNTTSDLLNPDKNGVVIFYIDGNGESWASNSGNQPGSSFESVSLTDETRTDVSSEKVWTARFSCMIYNAAGNSIKVENGEVCGPLILR